MNVKQTIDIVMGRLGNRTAAGLREKVLLEMRECQENDLEGGATLPWFIITENATTKTTAGERRVSLPPDFIREVEEKDFIQVLDGENDVRLVKMGYDRAIAEFGDEASGQPQAYVLRGNYFLLFPVPDAEYTLKLPGYYARQDIPIDSESSENAWFKNQSDYLLAKAGLTVASLYLKDPEVVAVFDSLLKRAERRIFVAEVARQEANRERNQGED